MQQTTKYGIRWSTASAYLRPAMFRTNLDIVTGAHVTGLLWDGSTADGVSFVRGGQLQKVLAQKEVLLSAGSVGSPQLLMLSGVGPRDQLEKLGIPVVADLPVGENLRDHLNLFGPEWTLQEATACKYLVDTPFWGYLKYLLFGAGDAASCHLLAEGFVAIGDSTVDGVTRAVQIQMMGNLIGANVDILHKYEGMLNVEPRVFEALFGGMQGKHGMSSILIQTYPGSSGYIRLKSRDPFEYPEIEPNYFSNYQDVVTFREGIRKVQELFATQGFRKLGAKQHHVVHPDCKGHDYDSDPYWECYLRHMATTGFHPIGTCKMGRHGDQSAVVDPQLRVLGVRGLRVVDASVMPSHISGNINAATIMIAEKAADMIKQSVGVTGEDDPVSGRKVN